MPKIVLEELLGKDAGPWPTGTLTPFAACVVESTTAQGPFLLAELVCRRRFETGCDGLLALGSDTLAVTWRCTRCVDTGSIVGWQGTPFDGRTPSRSRPVEAVGLRLPVDELFLLRALTTEPDLRDALLGAVPLAAPREAVPRASLTLGATTWALLEREATEAAERAEGELRRSLDRLVGRIQARLW